MKTALTFKLPLGISATLKSDTPLPYTDKEEIIFQAYIPGIERATRGSGTIHIAYQHAKKESVHRRGKTLTVKGTLQTVENDIHHLLYSALRHELLKKEAYSVHAACVDVKGLILLVGHSGSGKTTIALELAKHGHNIFSGNKTVVTKGKAITGTRAMTIKTAPQQGNAITYGTRSAFLLPSYAKSGPIKAVYLVRLNDGHDREERIGSMSALHTLYPFFLDTVNADTIIGESLYSNEVTQKQKTTLVKMLRTMLKKTPVRTVTGSLPFVVGRIIHHET